MRDIAGLRQLVDRHLTASALMVELDEALSPETRALEAKRRLDRNDNDMALIETEELKIVRRSRLRSLAREQLGRAVIDFAESPPRGRLIEQTLPIREVVRKLLADADPLLVVGSGGITHLVTRADFGGAAGTAVLLSFLVAVDSALNELLLANREAAWAILSPERREEAERRRAEAAEEDAALDPIEYLGMGSRLWVLRQLALHRKHDLGSWRDHELLLRVRNAAAHGAISDPERALEVIDLAESMLARLSDVLGSRTDRELGS